MNQDIPRDLSIKIDRLLELVAAGKVAPDPLDLLRAAITLRHHGELVRAERCEALARRVGPSLTRNLG